MGDFVVKEGVRLKAFDKAKAILNAYTEEIAHHKQLGRPVVCNAIYFPRELVESYDVINIPGEWYSAASGPSQNVGLLEIAEAGGFPHELCPYSRMHLGSMIANEGFLGEFPKPDVVIGLAGTCNIEAQWFEFVARYFNVPFFIMDYPPVNAYQHREDAENDAIEYFVQRAYRYIDFMEQTIGQKLNEEKLINACIVQHRCAELWQQIMELWQAVPSPIRFRTLLTFLPLWLDLACRPEAAEFALSLRDELAQRVRDGVSGISQERIRLFWYGMVPYYHMRMLDLFEAKGAAIVANTYWSDWDIRIPEAGITRWFRDWSEPTNLRECLWGLGKRWIGHHDYVSIRNRVVRNVERVKLAKVDGLAFASTRMCRRASKGELDILKNIKQALGIPTLFFEYSTSDPRDYSKAEVERRLDTFIEQIVAAKELQD